MQFLYQVKTRQINKEVILKSLRHTVPWRAFSRKLLTYNRRLSKLIWWSVTLQIHKKIWNRWYINKITPEKKGNEKCLKLPFEFFNDSLKSPKNIAVICHVFYPELLAEILSFLKNIPYSYDLFITTNSLEKHDLISNHLRSNHVDKFEVRVVENRGRDIAPKLLGCSDIYLHYEFFLHLHTKKSPHASNLSGWRNYLLKSLLGSRKIVENIFDAFDADPKLGMIAPQHFYPLGRAVGWGENNSHIKELFNRLEIDDSNLDKIDFPSGSMFWGRSAALFPFLHINLASADFSEECGQVDGTMAHAIERLFFYVCEKAGFRWIKIIVEPFITENDDGITLTNNSNEILPNILSSQYFLLGSKPDSVYANEKGVRH